MLNDFAFYVKRYLIINDCNQLYFTAITKKEIDRDKKYGTPIYIVH